MTHILVVTEGFPEGMDSMIRDIKELNYRVKSGAEYEIGLRAQPDIREVRFYDIVVKEDIKEAFLADLRHHVGFSSITELESDVRPGQPLHGLDAKEGFKIGLFRKMLQTVMGFVGARPLDMSKVKPSADDQLGQIVKRNGSRWHSYIMVLGELPDGFEKFGHNKGREYS